MYDVSFKECTCEQVGDNPAADVRGANRAGPPWVSVLVRTGVFSGQPGSNSAEDPAQVRRAVLHGVFADRLRVGETWTYARQTSPASIYWGQARSLLGTSMMRPRLGRG